MAGVHEQTASPNNVQFWYIFMPESDKMQKLWKLGKMGVGSETNPSTYVSYFGRYNVYNESQNRWSSNMSIDAKLRAYTQ